MSDDVTRVIGSVNGDALYVVVIGRKTYDRLRELSTTSADVPDWIEYDVSPGPTVKIAASKTYWFTELDRFVQTTSP